MHLQVVDGGDSLQI